MELKSAQISLEWSKSRKSATPRIGITALFGKYEFTTSLGLEPMLAIEADKYKREPSLREEQLVKLLPEWEVVVLERYERDKENRQIAKERTAYLEKRNLESGSLRAREIFGKNWGAICDQAVNKLQSNGDYTKYSINEILFILFSCIFDKKISWTNEYNKHPIMKMDFYFVCLQKEDSTINYFCFEKGRVVAEVSSEDIKKLNLEEILFYEIEVSNIIDIINFIDIK